MPVMASRRLVAEFLLQAVGVLPPYLVPAPVPTCAQEHPEAEAEVGALEAHTVQPVGGEVKALHHLRN